MTDQSLTCSGLCSKRSFGWESGSHQTATDYESHPSRDTPPATLVGCTPADVLLLLLADQHWTVHLPHPGSTLLHLKVTTWHVLIILYCFILLQMDAKTNVNFHGEKRFPLNLNTKCSREHWYLIDAFQHHETGKHEEDLPYDYGCWRQARTIWQLSLASLWI